MKIVVFGAGDIAALAHFYLSRDSPHEVIAFTVDRAYIKEETFGGLPVIPFDEITARYPAGDFGMFVALSYSQVNEVRAQKYAEAKALGAGGVVRPRTRRLPHRALHARGRVKRYPAGGKAQTCS